MNGQQGYDQNYQQDNNQNNQQNSDGISCSKCGQINPQGSYNCQNCGANLY